MAYYDNLKAAWVYGVLPAGVTGTALATTHTTAQKIAKINAWIVAGSAARMVLPTTEIYHAIVPSEFQALLATEQQYVRDVLNLGTADVSEGTNARAVLLAAFPSTTGTHAAFIALAKAYDTPSAPWWQESGYSSPINGNDAALAGVS